MDQVQDVVRRVRDWRRDFTDGGLRDLALVKPKREAGERLAAKVPHVGTKELPPDFGPDDLDWGGAFRPTIKIEGLLYATDRRVLVLGNGAKVRHEWRYADLTELTVIAGAKGLALTRAADPSTIAGILVSPDRSMFSRDWPALFARLLAVEGAFVASRGGDLDGWEATIAARFELPEGR